MMLSIVLLMTVVALLIPADFRWPDLIRYETFAEIFQRAADIPRKCKLVRSRKSMVDITSSRHLTKKTMDP